MNESSLSVIDYFSDRAELYARFRPDYPDAAAALLLKNLPTRLRVADIGSGTGISTRWLARHGATVVGVEPDRVMLEQAHRLCPPGVQYRPGTAEATGLETASFDLVTCAQAFHWFDPEPALREFHRLLRPGGRLALLWNVRDNSTPIGAAYARVVTTAEKAVRYESRVTRCNRSMDPGIAGLFIGVGKWRIPNPLELTWEELLGRLRSESCFPSGGPLHQQLTEDLRTTFVIHQRHGRIAFAQHTDLILAEAVPAVRPQFR